MPGRLVQDRGMSPFDARLDTEVPALLLRLDRNPFHHGSLGAVRSLGRAGVEVHAFVESARGPLGRSRYLHTGHPLAPRASGLAGTERALLRAAERIGRPAVLIAMDDAGAIAAARLAARLAGRFLLPAQPRPWLLERVADKAELAGLCRRLGIPHPATEVPGSAEQAEAAARRLGLPLVAKWSRPWLLPDRGRAAGLRSTTVLTRAEQARRLFARTPLAGPGNRLVLQRLVLGGPGADWFFHGCFAAGGHCLLGGTGRKELSWPVGAGLTALGRWLPNAEVAAVARRLAADLGYAGVLDLDLRREAVTGAYHLLDVNPRPGAQFRLFTDGGGLDVVRALHLDLTGRRVPAPRPVPGRVFLAENYGLASGLVSALTGRGVGGRWAHRRRGVETAWFAADDPAPFWAMAGSWGPGRLGRRIARRRHPADSAADRAADGAVRADGPERAERT
jgi:predicted ATP-grasp superfamily ATP-dependent carboligase